MKQRKGKRSKDKKNAPDLNDVELVKLRPVYLRVQRCCHPENEIQTISRYYKKKKKKSDKLETKHKS